MAIDDYYIKFPTCVLDVARVIVDLIGRTQIEIISPKDLLKKNEKKTDKKRELGPELSGVFHFSSEEKMTKFNMCEAIAQALGRDMSHLSRNSEPPKAGAGVFFFALPFLDVFSLGS